MELSALRLHEVDPLLAAIADGSLPLSNYRYISFHAPSSFPADAEEELVQKLRVGVPRSWPIILHPDAIRRLDLWRQFGPQLAIENMDRRKSSGRTLEELVEIFAALPEANMCFDIGHARQCDTSMTESYRILRALGRRVVQVHISDVTTSSHHDPISFAAKIAFQQVASLISAGVPVIVESRVGEHAISEELSRVAEALPVSKPQLIAVRA